MTDDPEGAAADGARAAEAAATLAAAEPYVRQFEATVRSVEGSAVTLDHSYFYPEGGGQPADRGTIDGVEVVDVRTRDGDVVHHLGADPDFEPGATVTGRVDDEFRTYAMRAHTASHVVYGAGRRLLDERGYAGFDIGPETVRLDFDTGDDAGSVDPLEFQRLVAEVVWEGREVTWGARDADAAAADDEVVFNLPDGTAAADTVRVVAVEGWDVSACGGTHVRNTVEIGPVDVREVSNPGADRIRVEFAVGPAAFETAVRRRRQAERAADRLDTGVADLPERAGSLLAEVESLREQRETLADRLFEARLAALAADPVERNGREWLVGTVEGLGPNAVADRLRDDDRDRVVALAGEQGSTFLVVATDGSVDATDVLEEATEAFGGGGGGQPTLAQGGGMDADPGAVAEHLRR